MLRPAIRPIVIAAMASGIASRALDEADLSSPGRQTIQALLDTADHFVSTWPDRLRSRREQDDIGKHLSMFIQKTRWDYRPRHIQTYMNFLAALLEACRECVRQKQKLRMIEQLLDQITSVWRLYSSGEDREYEWCMQAGIRAAAVWTKIMEGG